MADRDFTPQPSVDPRLVTRFEAKVLRDRACWEWTGYKLKGYGRFNMRGVVWYAHRLAWEIYVGAIPIGMQVLHSCDNPGCVNPAHLFLGSQADNMADMDRKKRRRMPSRTAAAKGESHGMAKLTNFEIRCIRKFAECGWEQYNIAKIFEVHPATISRILSGRRWKHVR